MESSEALALNKFFSQATLRQLAEEGASEAYLEAVARCVPGGAGKTHGECVRELYRRLETGYRNEYFYKRGLGYGCGKGGDAALPSKASTGMVFIGGDDERGPLVVEDSKLSKRERSWLRGQLAA